MTTLSKNVMQHRKVLKETGLAFAKSIPLVGPHIEAAEKMFTLFSEINATTCRDRFNRYIMGIGEICDDEVDISREHFSALVKKLVLDDEDKKTEYYIRLTVSLARSSLNDDEKLFFIHILSGLTCFDIEYARKLYITTNSPIRGFKSAATAQVDLTSQKNGLYLRSLNKLISSGLIYEAINTHPERNRLFHFTEELETLLGYLFNRDDMLPASLGMETKKSYDVVLIEKDEPFDEFCRKRIYSELKASGYCVHIAKNEDAISDIIASCYVSTRTGNGLDDTPYGVIELFEHSNASSDGFKGYRHSETFDPNNLKITSDGSIDSEELATAIDRIVAYVRHLLPVSI